MNISICINLTTLIKWTNSLKSTSYYNILYEIDSLNNPITLIKIKFIIGKLPKSKSIGSDSFTREAYQIFRKELTPEKKCYKTRII